MAVAPGKQRAQHVRSQVLVGHAFKRMQRLVAGSARRDVASLDAVLRRRRGPRCALEAGNRGREQTQPRCSQPNRLASATVAAPCALR
jgi:hypothetical protein